ncbi:MAG: RsbRD N-terminal domain-containing protein [Desulfobacterales bacterium]|nr:RsbRD N-terminal domain-containing protein [Desulfobacterales bacterium]
MNLSKTLKKVLQEKKDKILSEWFEVVIHAYPDDMAYFLKREKDAFANPVGQNIWNTIETIYKELLDSFDKEKIASGIDPLIRTRAVQNFRASESVKFVFSLKEIIRNNFDFKDEDGGKSLYQLERMIDEIALIGFDIYMNCKEKIYQLKANHERSQTMKLLEKANLLCECNNE